MNNIEQFVEKAFQQALPTFLQLLAIPSQSKMFDPEYLTNGYLNQTANMFRDYIKSMELNGASIHLMQDEGYSPFIHVEIPSFQYDNGAKTILFYGHIDKQPPFTGWSEGLGPYAPKIIDDNLYARGGADDHYSVFAAVIAIKALQIHGIRHPRIVMVFEADEESGSGHVEYYLEKIKQQIGGVDVIFCLDSGCLNYDQLWLTTSLRGVLTANVSVKVLEEGVHSGGAGGIIPSSFRILRNLLSRIEDPVTGECAPEFQVNIPGEAYAHAYRTAETMKDELINQYKLVSEPTTTDPFKAYVNNVWKAQLEVIGAGDIPSIQNAGNVLRPQTSLALSMRLPPTKDPKEAAKAFEQLLTINVPYKAQVRINDLTSEPGFYGQSSQEMEEIIESASKKYFNKGFACLGEGGSIPLMSQLQQMRYPKAQFIIIGVLGPNSNAHGPNECLNIKYLKKLICCVSDICGKV